LLRASALAQPSADAPTASATACYPIALVSIGLTRPPLGRISGRNGIGANT